LTGKKHGPENCKYIVITRCHSKGSGKGAAVTITGRNTERPLGRVGTVDNIAGAVMFPASDEASFITGDALVVDGGCVAG
jgi:NAD(P)-dependent dehydrogenase (short-subunit alcohol dehydrogenase family)